MSTYTSNNGKGRKKAMKTLKSMLEQRLDQPREEQKDFIDLHVKELNKEGSTLTKAISDDLLLVLLFASFETTTQSTTFCMNEALADHPEGLEELTVIKETLRLGNIAPVILRKSLADNTIKDFTRLTMAASLHHLATRYRYNCGWIHFHVQKLNSFCHYFNDPSHKDT
ncbi:Cytochrome P450 87A3 [Nymphaea thermarum]|nr:Cytochrome P450 87A3 [Nymphaea thermarum]